MPWIQEEAAPGKLLMHSDEIIPLERLKKEQIYAYAHLNTKGLDDEAADLQTIKILAPKSYDQARGFDSDAVPQAVTDFRENLMWQLYEAVIVKGLEPKRAPSVEQFAQDASASSISRAAAKDHSSMSAISQKDFVALCDLANFSAFRRDAPEYTTDDARGLIEAFYNADIRKKAENPAYRDSMLQLLASKLKNDSTWVWLHQNVYNRKSNERTDAAPLARIDTPPAITGESARIAHQWKLDARGGERAGVSLVDYRARFASRVTLSTLAHQAQRIRTDKGEVDANALPSEQARQKATLRSMNAHKNGGGQ